jgi:cytochrome c553
MRRTRRRTPGKRAKRSRNAWPTIKGEKKLPEDKKKLNLKLAMHTNCQGCHKKLKKKDKEKYKKIPTTCIKCHTKSKKK